MAQKIIIYQLLPRLFSNSNATRKFYGSIGENGCGKFNDINHAAIQSIKDLGVTHIWLTGIIQHATMTDYSQYGIPSDNAWVVKGKAGSPYAIKNYYDVCPDFAESVPNRMQEFQDLVNRIHAKGLKVLIDLVPNHVARSYSQAPPVETSNRPDGGALFYPLFTPLTLPEGISLPPDIEAEPYQENPAWATGNDVFHAQPSIYDWYETIKLNYGVNYQTGERNFDPIPPTWEMIRDILAFWTSKGVDGFRCDMAEMVPVEFWAWLIPQIKALNQEISFSAEIYNPQQYHNYLFHGKFDYLYDKVGLYDSLRRLMEGNGNANDITQVWQRESGEFQERMLRFLENHDEQRIASVTFASDAFRAIPAMAVSVLMHRNPILIYFGQELGIGDDLAAGFRGGDGRTTIFDYWSLDPLIRWNNGGQWNEDKLNESEKTLRNFYRNLNHFCQENEAIHSGEFYDLQYAQNYDTSKIYSFLRFTDNQKLLIICNFDHESHEINITIPDHARNVVGLQNESLYFKEIFLHSGHHQGKFTLDANSFKAFEINPKI